MSFILLGVGVMIASQLWSVASALWRIVHHLEARDDR